MMLYRYRAISMQAPTRGNVVRGERSGDHPAQVRASLRVAGLQVIDLRPVHGPVLKWGWFESRIHSSLRKRRQLPRGDLQDSLATMLAAGIPLAEALRSISQNDDESPSKSRQMVSRLHEKVRSGASLAEAMEQEPSWFEPVEVALVRAGEQSGSLPHVLQRLSEQQAKKNELGQKIVGALAYPAVIACVGFAVLVFLSTKTLPEFVEILQGASIDPPALTLAVMGIGQWVVAWMGWLLVLAVVLVVVGPMTIARRSRTVQGALAAKITPKFLRRAALSKLASHLSELTREGVPLADSLRMLLGSIANVSLQEALRDTLRSLEEGKSLQRSLSDRTWFDGEFVQLVGVGEASGELSAVLDKLAARYERRAHRLMDRFATMLEPTVILLFALGVGCVVMAAILPMVRLQEML